MPILGALARAALARTVLIALLLPVATGEAAAAAPTITDCNTGHWASVAWFTLYAIEGKTDTTLYDGSMVEWTANPTLPVAPPAQ